MNDPQIHWTVVVNKRRLEVRNVEMENGKTKSRLHGKGGSLKGLCATVLGTIDPFPAALLSSGFVDGGAIED